MSKSTLFVLGAADPEMVAIENLLREVGVPFTHAVDADGRRVHPGNAYKCAPVEGATHWVECAPAEGHDGVVIDHHRPGDPGYGRGSQDFWLASSLGQVAQVLGDRGPFEAHGPDGPWWPNSLELLLAAAADHCLASAYQGWCPGVRPDELMRWRAQSRAAFQKRPVEDVLRDVERARARLLAAIRPQGTEGWDWPDGENPPPELCPEFADLRGETIPELPEAAAREGIAFLSEVPDRDGRRKVVLQAAPPGLIHRFLKGELVPELVDRYGDPARGFAGGYLP